VYRNLRVSVYGSHVAERRTAARVAWSTTCGASGSSATAARRDRHAIRRKGTLHTSSTYRPHGLPVTGPRLESSVRLYFRRPTFVLARVKNCTKEVHDAQKASWRRGQTASNKSTTHRHPSGQPPYKWTSRYGMIPASGKEPHGTIDAKCEKGACFSGPRGRTSRYP